MLDALLTQYDRNLDYAKRLVADIPDARWCQQAAPTAMNHGAWVIGHLALVADVYLAAFGGQPTAPAEWGPLLGGGSKPQPDPAAYPGKLALLKALGDGHERMKALVRAQPATYWNEPPLEEKRRARFPTNGHMLIHALINHEAIHLGQLSAWRRAQGLPSV